MGLRIDAPNEFYTVSAAEITTVATVLGWFRIDTDRNAYSGIWALGAGDTPEAYFGPGPDGTTVYLGDGGFVEFGAVATTVGTWYRYAVRLNGSAFSFRIGAAGSAMSSFSQTRTALSSPTNFYIGHNSFTADWVNGTHANISLYSAVLTDAEEDAELARYMPTRLSNLVRRHWFINPETPNRAGTGGALTATGSPTTTDGPPIPWGHGGGRRVTLAAGGSSDLLGQAAAAETATPLTRSKTRILGQAVETAAAHPVAAAKRRALSAAAETDTATPLARSKRRTLAAATEADTATAAGAVKRRELAQPTETDTAHPVTTADAALGRGVETDTAHPVGRAKARLLGIAVETATAGTLGAAKGRALARAVETDTATASGRSKLRALAGASETDTAAGVGRRKQRALAQAADTHLPHPVGSASPLTQAASTDTALPVGRRKVRQLGQAVETVTAGVLGRLKARLLGQPVEVDTAAAVTTSGDLSFVCQELAGPVVTVDLGAAALVVSLDGTAAVDDVGDLAGAVTVTQYAGTGITAEHTGAAVAVTLDGTAAVTSYAGTAVLCGR